MDEIATASILIYYIASDFTLRPTMPLSLNFRQNQLH